jgi:hypothetical protein
MGVKLAHSQPKDENTESAIFMKHHMYSIIRNVKQEDMQQEQHTQEKCLHYLGGKFEERTTCQTYIYRVRQRIGRFLMLTKN